MNAIHPETSVRIWTELGEAGARRGAERGDTVIVIDALRASTTIPTALQAGAIQVIPVLTVEQANAYLDDPTCVIAGERGGSKVAGFSFGNSPTEIWTHRRQIAKKTLVLTTSNGTRCTNAALEGSSIVIVGALVNASAVAKCAISLAREQAGDITLVAAGLNEQPSDEDSFALGAIGRRLIDLGATPVTPILRIKEAASLHLFLATQAAAHLIGLGYEQDVRFCAQIDLWNVVPIYQGVGFVKA
ncbi:MAG: 2-phosphosulfolactate phosphatase [Anaerolineae bacterium]|nr:2-phosphosulfolactate phosphatase [Anaerolineae bacterium]